MSRIIRFLVSGGSAAAVEYVAFVCLQFALGADALFICQSISFGCGFLVSFLLNRYWVFGSEGNAGAELVKYTILAAINLALGNLAISLLVYSIEWHPLLAKLVVMLMIAVWNYFIFSRLIFRSSKKTVSGDPLDRPPIIPGQ